MPNCRHAMRAHLGHPNMNPRVLLWAKANGVDFMKLQRDRVEDPLYEVNGVPWTIEFTQWTQARWREFYKQCHGNEHMLIECCGSAAEDGRFDRWLYKQVTGEEWEDVQP